MWCDILDCPKLQGQHASISVHAHDHARMIVHKIDLPHRLFSQAPGTTSPPAEQVSGQLLVQGSPGAIDCWAGQPQNPSVHTKKSWQSEVTTHG